MDFPVARYRRAGATLEEIVALVEQFHALPEPAQRVRLGEIAGIADYDIAEQLDRQRFAHLAESADADSFLNGLDSPGPETTEPEPETVEESDPVEDTAGEKPAGRRNS